MPETVPAVRAGECDEAEAQLRLGLIVDLDAGFAEVMRTYERLVFSVALRLSPSRDDAEDVAAEAFLRAYRALRTYDATRLREEESARGKLAEFELLEPFLSNAPQEDEYLAIAARLGIARNSVAVAIHRLGKRYRDLLRHEVAQTVNDPSEIDDELAYLVKVLTR